MALCKTFHFIHIGKTGGTAVKNMARERASSLVVHNHYGTLPKLTKIDKKLQAGGCFAFFLRDPVDRWISGFLSRARHGCPDHCHSNINSAQEYWGFHTFPTPDALASALDTELGQRVNNLTEHTKNDISHYVPLNILREHSDQIFFVGDMTHLDADVATMLRLADTQNSNSEASPHLSRQLRRPKTPADKGMALWSTSTSTGSHTHANPPALANLTVLSARSRCILERHLAKDYAVTDFLFAHNLSRIHYSKQCTRAALQSKEVEVADRLAKTVSMDAYTIKTNITCGHGGGKARVRACENIYKHLLMGDLYDPQD